MACRCLSDRCPGSGWFEVFLTEVGNLAEMPLVCQLLTTGDAPAAPRVIAPHKEDLTRQQIEQREAEWMAQFGQQPARVS